MASHARIPARIATATLVLAGLVLAALPATLADPGARAAAGSAHLADRGAERSARTPSPFHVHLEGTGTDRDNHTYSIVLDGEARGQTKKNETGDVVAFRGIAELQITVTDENGTVVKERMLRGVVRGHLTEDGWTWKLHAFGQRHHGLPQIHLRGEANPTTTGFDLEGQGRAGFARTLPGPSLRLRIDSMEGSITKS